MVELSQVRGDSRIASRELGLHHTYGRMVQNGGSLRETEEIAAGGAGGAVGRRAWRALAMAWTSSVSRDIVRKMARGE